MTHQRSKTFCPWPTGKGYAAMAPAFRAWGNGTVYRGVAGYGQMRDVRGLHWTFSIDTAKQAADWYPGFFDPGVYQADDTDADIYFYNAGHQGRGYAISLKGPMLSVCGLWNDNH